MNDIDSRKHRLRRHLRRLWAEVQPLETDTATSRIHGEELWNRKISDVEREVVDLNRKIDNFNLIKPERLDIFRLRIKLGEEIAAVKREPVQREELPRAVKIKTEEKSIAPIQKLSGKVFYLLKRLKTMLLPQNSLGYVRRGREEEQKPSA